MLLLRAKTSDIYINLIKICNITDIITQLLIIFIWYTNMEKFTYNNYLAIFIFNLRLYIIKIDMQLDKYYNFFYLKWGILRFCYYINNANIFLMPLNLKFILEIFNPFF